MPPPPDDAWSAAYPARLSLFDARALVVAPVAPSPDDVARAQVSAAYRVEELVRSWSAGTHHTGVIMSRRALVTNGSWADDVAAIWDAAPRTPDVQRLVDRALVHLSRAFDEGLGCFEWDRPGYDEVTDRFAALFDRATPALRVAIDPPPEGPPFSPAAAAAWRFRRHGPRVRVVDDGVERIPFDPDTWDSPYAPKPATDAAPSRPPSADSIARALGFVVMLVGVALLASLVLADVLGRGGRGADEARAAKPVTCADAKSTARTHLTRVQARLAAGATPDDEAAATTLAARVAAVDAALGHLDGGTVAAAKAALARTPHPRDDADATLAGTYLFLADVECAR